MIGGSIKRSHDSDADQTKEILLDFVTRSSKKSVCRDADQLLELYDAYDAAFVAATEYFIYYYIIAAPSVVDYFNAVEGGKTWQFIGDAVFDEGVNALWQFFDNKGLNIVQRFDKAFGTKIGRLIQDERIKELKEYRHKRAAHRNRNVHEKTSIRYETPIHVLNKLRAAKTKFDDGAGLSQSIYMFDIENLCTMRINWMLNDLRMPENMSEKILEEVHNLCL